MRSRTILRYGFSGVSFAVGVVFTANLEKFLGIKGWDNLIAQGAAATGIAALILNPWVWITAIAILAFTAGLWIDNILAKVEARPRKKSRKEIAYERLGRDAVILGTVCHAATTSYITQDAGLLMSQVYSMLIRFEKLGFATPAGPEAAPDANRALNLASRYFTFVGQLLRDGNTLEAQHVAQEISEESEHSQFRCANRILVQETL